MATANLHANGLPDRAEAAPAASVRLGASSPVRHIALVLDPSRLWSRPLGARHHDAYRQAGVVDQPLRQLAMRYASVRDFVIDAAAMCAGIAGVALMQRCSKEVFACRFDGIGSHPPAARLLSLPAA